MDSTWAVAEITTRVKRKDLAGATALARSLFPFWSHLHFSELADPLFIATLTIALALEDTELAGALVAPFRRAHLTPDAMPFFAALVERYGLAWAQGSFTAWTERERLAVHVVKVFARLPELHRALVNQAPKHGKAFAAWLLTREVDVFEQALVDRLKATPIWPGPEKAGALSEAILGLLLGATTIDAVAIRKHIVALISTGSAALSVFERDALFEACLREHAPETVGTIGLGGMVRDTIEEVDSILHAAPRASDDWSMEWPLHCKCELCGVLLTFLRDRQGIEHKWPLAKERRQHIHRVLDACKLPVSHVTIRRGSPHVLVLTKQDALFAGEAAIRARHQGLLERLRTHERRLGEGLNAALARRLL
jgi:hypothetical protein